MKLFIKFFTISLLILVISCSDDSDPTSPNEDLSAKELSLKQITLPAAMQQSNNSYAKTAFVYITLANSFQIYSAFYTPPDNSNLLKQLEANDDWTKSWTIDGVTIKMDYYEDATKFGWKTYLSGTDGEDVFSNWLFIEAEELVLLNQGYMKVYKQNSTDLQSEWNYSTSAQGVYSFIYSSYDDGISNRFEIFSNSDNSGEISIYNVSNGNFVLDSKIDWNSDGTGQWWKYDLAGNVIDSGSF
jgi:hypothetical protein